MLKVSQNDENHCATFCGKPVETVETVENAQARKEWIKPRSAFATHGRTLKRLSKQRNEKASKEKITNSLQNSKMTTKHIEKMK